VHRIFATSNHEPGDLDRHGHISGQRCRFHSGPCGHSPRTGLSARHAEWTGAYAFISNTTVVAHEMAMERYELLGVKVYQLNICEAISREPAR
jgi:hypothetical protein